MLANKAVIEKYRENQHVSHIVYNEANSGGTFKQWEKGISLSKGDNNTHYYLYIVVLLLYHKYMNLTLLDDYSYVLREHNVITWLIERYNT